MWRRLAEWEAEAAQAEPTGAHELGRRDGVSVCVCVCVGAGPSGTKSPLLTSRLLVPRRAGPLRRGSAAAGSTAASPWRSSFRLRRRRLAAVHHRGRRLRGRLLGHRLRLGGRRLRRRRVVGVDVGVALGIALLPRADVERTSPDLWAASATARCCCAARRPAVARARRPRRRSPHAVGHVSRELAPHSSHSTSAWPAHSSQSISSSTSSSSPQSKRSPQPSHTGASWCDP